MYSTLNQKAKENLINAFAKFGHKPSQSQLIALLSIQESLTLMLFGIALPKYYLSSLDPGVGKTTAILAWLDAYLENPFAYGNQGVLIALDRLEEIQRYIDDGLMPQECFAVLVNKYTEEGRALNKMGLGEKARDNAMILFTTKAQVHRRCCCGNFEMVKAFQYHGQPRRVKVWDESFSIGKEAILNPYDFGRLLTGLNDTSPELSDAVLQVVNDIKDHKNGDTYTIPELPALPDERTQGTIWESSKDRELADLLWRLSGQPVSIHMDKNRQILVDCVPSIPDDFAPCLILDASARLKATYALQAEERRDIIHLPYSNKSYRNLEVQLWARSSGKQIIKDMPVVLPEIVAVITSRPGERFLIILHKDHREPVSKALSRQLSTTEQQLVSYCTWARHTATNEFSDIANIIMLSPYQFPDYAYEAMTRAATMLTTAHGKPNKDHVQRTKRGAISSNILQAVNRGTVRKSENDTCPPCRLWLIAHQNTGIASELQTIFPGCKVAPWKLKSVHLPSTKQQRTFDHIQSLIKHGVTEVLSTTVRNYLEFKGSASNFTRDVINQSTFVNALDRIGWRCVKIGREYVFQGIQAVQAI